MAVSMSVVSQSTNKMKEPRRMTPGISNRRAARMRIIRRNISVKPAVTTPNGKSLQDMSCSGPCKTEYFYIPWYPDPQLLLYDHKPCEYAQHSRCCRKNDEDPEIELYFRPAVFPTGLAIYNFCGHCDVWMLLFVRTADVALSLMCSSSSVGLFCI